MNYRPNIEAVTWFATEIFPAVRRRVPAAEFWIVGAHPAPAVRALEGDGVRVTGQVPDVRPYLAHAGCVVAPLKIARGVQNKVLEAMAMARVVVATPEAREGIDASAGDRDRGRRRREPYWRAVCSALAGKYAEWASGPACACRRAMAGSAISTVLILCFRFPVFDAVGSLGLFRMTDF